MINPKNTDHKIQNSYGIHATFCEYLLYEITSGVISDNNMWHNISEECRDYQLVTDANNAIAAPHSEQLCDEYDPETVLYQKYLSQKLLSILFSGEKEDFTFALEVISSQSNFICARIYITEFITDYLKEALMQFCADNIYLGLFIVAALLREEKFPYLDLIPLITCVMRACFAEHVLPDGEVTTNGRNSFDIRKLAAETLYAFVERYDNADLDIQYLIMVAIMYGIEKNTAPMGTLYAWATYFCLGDLLYCFFDELEGLLPKLLEQLKKYEYEPMIKFATNELIQAIARVENDV